MTISLSAIAIDRYVATDGTDTPNDCTNQATPCLTITYAITQTTNTDDIYIAAGTYREANISLVNRRLSFIGESAETTIIDADTDEDGTGDGRIFYIDNSEIDIGRLTLTHGLSSDNGGAILLESSTVLVAECILSENKSDGNDGGAIFSDGILHVYNTLLTNNTADDGGAIYADFGTLLINLSTISNNTAEDQGGGIYNSADMRMYLTTVDSNKAEHHTDGMGGGILTRSKMWILYSTIINNESAAEGGGIALGNNNIETVLVNSTLSGNSAGTYGGGIAIGAHTSMGYTKLHNVTITNNIADANEDGAGNGGGIVIYDNNKNKLYTENSIIAGNTTAGVSDECIRFGAGSIISNGYNILGESELLASCDGYFTAAGDLTNQDVTTVLNTTLADNGGPTLTHALLATSPAIDAGDPLGCRDNLPAPQVLDYDQRDFERPVNSHCDIGAVEFGICGDSALDDGEACDDGNTDDEDGCSATCEVEEITAAESEEAEEESESTEASADEDVEASADGNGGCSLSESTTTNAGILIPIIMLLSLVFVMRRKCYS